jgi:hypothetical protein
VLEEFSKVIANSSTDIPIFLTGFSMFNVFAIPLRKIVNFLVNDKGLFTPSARLLIPFVISILTIFISTIAFAQERPLQPPSLRVNPDTIPQKPDSLQMVPDSLGAKSDTTYRKEDSDIETVINYTARDSIRASMDSKMIWLYGDAKIKYGTIELEADEITIDYANSTLTAHGSRDSLGNRIGYPVFKNGAELYETKDIVYNFKTGRARISEVVTQQGEGYVAGAAAFKNEKNELLSLNNSYTTCNLEHPHFVIRATKTKAIPNDKIVSGPFYIEFNDIPLPIGFLFGMFPAQRESASGLLFPAYGEERRRGFNLRNGGYFFDISDYMKLSLTGDIYSKGGHAIYAVSNYIKRYKYNGNFNITYSKNKNSDNIENPQVSNDFRITWSHSPQSKGNSRFGASVNAATTTFTQNNNLIPGLQTNYSNTAGISNFSTKLNSNISYSKRFAGTPFSMGLNLSHNQDLATKQVDLQLPSLSLNMTNVYPFQRKGKTGKLDNLSLGYSMTAVNRITNNLGRIGSDLTRDSIAPFDMTNLPVFFENGKKGIRHSIPVSYSFKVLRFFTMSPSISLDERWYFEKLSWRYVKDERDNYVAKADTVQGFNRITNYSMSTSLTTRIYGIYFFKRGKVKALRHVVNPSVSFNYAPDFSTNPEYFDVISKPSGIDNAYRPQVTVKSRHENFVYQGSQPGRVGSIGFSLGNNLEMKIKGEKDTVERKVMLLNNFSISSGYNIVADSFKLSPFSLAANTNVLDNKLNINVSASLDPYSIVKVTDPETGRVIERRFDTYAWKGGGIGRITSATLAIGTNLNPDKRESDQQTREAAAKSNLSEENKQRIIQNPNVYIDFDIPWSLNLNYNLSYSHQLNNPAKVTSTITISGDLSLTEKWKINFNSGYHFETKEFTQTSVSIARDLHCWAMNLWWVPFGRFQSYNFSIHVKASVLKDLKLDRRKPWQDTL